MKTFKKVAKWVGIIVGSLVVILGALYLVYVQPVMTKLQSQNTVHYDQNLTIYEGGGGNTGVLVSDSLVIVIDTKMGSAAEELATTVKEVANGKPILAINTHYHIDHTSGNRLFNGHTLLAGGGYTPETWVKEGSKEDMPTEWLRDKKDIIVNDDTVTIFTLNMVAHTAGDVFVYLHNRKMLFGGDVILNGQVPSINNGQPEGYLTAFDRLQSEFDIRKVVPGHGPIGGIEILENFRQYFIDMKTAANDASRHDVLVDKYKDWTQVPMLMSSGNVIDGFRKNEE
jgi:glyoxylase-like metal-dependent hydrolase (beta-lactamase superfamily II)